MLPRLPSPEMTLDTDSESPPPFVSPYKKGKQTLQKKNEATTPRKTKKRHIPITPISTTPSTPFITPPSRGRIITTTSTPSTRGRDRSASPCRSDAPRSSSKVRNRTIDLVDFTTPEKNRSVVDPAEFDVDLDTLGQAGSSPLGLSGISSQYRSMWSGKARRASGGRPAAAAAAAAAKANEKVGAATSATSPFLHGTEEAGGKQTGFNSLPVTPSTKIAKPPLRLPSLSLPTTPVQGSGQNLLSSQPQSPSMNVRDHVLGFLVGTHADLYPPNTTPTSTEASLTGSTPPSKKINLKVQDQQNNELHMRVKTTVQVEKCVAAFVEYFKVSTGGMRVRVDGENVDTSKSLMELNIETGAVIDLFFEALGGMQG